MAVTFEKVQTNEQVKTLAKLADGIWHEYFSSLLSPGQIDYMVEKFQSERAMTVQMEEEGYSYYFFMLEGAPIGYFGIKPDGDRLFLSKIYLKKEHRGNGYASLAFSFLEKLCKWKGYKAMWLTVNKHNEPSIAVYEKKGFLKIKSQITDIGNGYVMDDYVFEKSL